MDIQVTTVKTTSMNALREVHRVKMAALATTHLVATPAVVCQSFQEMTVRKMSMNALRLILVKMVLLVIIFSAVITAHVTQVSLVTTAP
jgi:hypothetical protein